MIVATPEPQVLRWHDKHRVFRRIKAWHRLVTAPVSLGASFPQKVKLTFILFEFQVRKAFGLKSRSFFYRIKFNNAEMPIWFPSISELYLLDGIFLKRIYDVPLASKEVHRIVDLGAHIGLASLFYASVYQNAVIEAYELDPGTIVFLKQNLRPFSNARVIGKAVSATGGTQTLFCGAASFSSSILPVGSVGGLREAGKVESVRLDDIVGEGIDILKIDISGSELPVLESCTKLEKIQAIVGHLAVSYTGQSQEDIVRLFSKTHEIIILQKAKIKTSTLVLAIRKGTLI